NLEVKKERLFLLEDQGKFLGASGALQEWNRMMLGMRDRIGQDAKLRDQYYECYYHLTNGIYKYAQTLSEPAKRRKEMAKAANYIVQLERTRADMGGEACKKRFDDLL